MKKRVPQWLAQVYRPELPIFGVALVASLIIVILAALVIWSTFLEGIPGTGATKYSLTNYAEVLLYPLTLEAARNTLVVALGTVLVSTFFAVPLAWLIYRTNIRGKKLFLTLMFLHVLLPGYLRTMGWIMLFSPSIGIVNQMLRLFIPVESGPLSIYNLQSIALLQGLALTPTMFFMVAGAFVALDPAFEEAAEVSGVSKFRSLLHISVPLVMPALVAGAIYNFMTAVSVFEVTALLGVAHGTHVFATIMYDFLHPDLGLPKYGIAGVYGVLLMVPATASLLYYHRMLRRSYRYASVTGKGYKPKVMDLGGWKWPALSFILIYYTFDLLLPFLAVLWTSFLPRLQLPAMAAFSTMSLRGYVSAMFLLGAGKVLTNTVQLVMGVGIVTTLVSLSFSWVVLRTRMTGRYVIDTISMLPHAIPGVAMAFSLVFVGMSLVNVIPLYGSLVSIILADGIGRIPFATRTISGSLIQIHMELEEAVQTSGGSRIVALKRVVMPLILPALFYSFVWSSLHAYREVTVALFLMSPRNMVLATSIWQRWVAGDMTAAAALGVIQVLGMGIILGVLLLAFPQVFLGRRQ